MIYLHREFDVGPDDEIEVTLNGPANVMLLDDTNFNHYREGKPYRYHGGFVKETPFQLSPPNFGHWHVVVNLGGYPGHLRASIQVIQPAGVAT